MFSFGGIVRIPYPFIFLFIFFSSLNFHFNFLSCSLIFLPFPFTMFFNFFSCFLIKNLTWRHSWGPLHFWRIGLWINVCFEGVVRIFCFQFIYVRPGKKYFQRYSTDDSLLKSFLRPLKGNINPLLILRFESSLFQMDSAWPAMRRTHGRWGSLSSGSVVVWPWSAHWCQSSTCYFPKRNSFRTSFFEGTSRMDDHMDYQPLKDSKNKRIGIP